MDRNGGSLLVAVELTCLPTSAAVDRWTETVGSVLVADKMTCLAKAAVAYRWTETGGSVLVAVELTCLATAADRKSVGRERVYGDV